MTNYKIDEIMTICTEKWVFKNIPKKNIPQFKKILEVLCKSPQKLRSQEISNKIDIPKKYVDSRLKRLRDKWIIKVSGLNRKYLRDTLNDNFLFPWKIGPKVDLYIRKLLTDSLNRDTIKSIILHYISMKEPNDKQIVLLELINNLNESSDLLTLLDYIKDYVGERNLLLFYQDLFDEILEKNLYNEVNGYGSLTWQCIAYKYFL